ncbi:low molecular weight protein-tyrosine-phosphatase [Lysobacter fragariae]
MRLVIVCLGNICRSPMAEGMLRARIETSPLAGRVVVDSAGLGEWHLGQPPDRRAIATAARHGVEISGLRARQLVATDYTSQDWLLCADHAVLREVQRNASANAHARSALLLEWSGIVGVEDVPDPYTGGPAEFEAVWELLDRATQGVMNRLQEELAGHRHG